MGGMKVTHAMLVGCLLAAAATVQGKDAMSSTGDADGVFALLDQLHSNDYAEREAADAALREMGTPILPYLTERYRQSEDLESQLRVQRIIEYVYFWDEVFSQNAFLGIEHVLHNNPADARLKENEAGIEIRRIIEGTSADRAGLQGGDLVIGVDGVRLSSGINVSTFAEMIRTKSPGDRMEFLIFRGTEMMTFDIELGIRPIPMYANRNRVPKELREHYDTQIAEFHEWWNDELGGRDPVRALRVNDMIRIGSDAQPMFDYSSGDDQP